MPEGFVLQEEIDSWLEEVGSDYTTVSHGQSIKVIPINVRREKLEILFRTLKALGKTRDFFVGPNREAIIKACLPIKKTLRKNKWNELSALVGKDIDYVKVKVFGKASDDSRDGKTEVVIDFKSNAELEGEKILEEAPDKPIYSSKPKPEPVKSKEFDRSKVSKSETSDIIDPNLEEWLRDK